MNGTESHWRAALLSRFADREDIGKKELYRRYFAEAGLPEAAVLECLDLIELEYNFPPGLLRPEDKLTKLFEPVATKNPWRWLVYQVKEGDSQSEIEYELSKRQRQYGTIGTWSRLETVNDLIRAWCGQKPK